MTQISAIRISVTDLDSFKWYEYSDMTLEQYLLRLKRIEQQTEAMLRGIAFHKLLERFATVRSMEQHPARLFDEYYDVDGFLFDLSEIKGVRILRTLIPELRVERTYTRFAPGAIEEVTLSGKLDGIVGTTVIDYKTSKQINFEYLAQTWQWRAYLAMLSSADRFLWYVFKIGSYKIGPTRVKADKRLEPYLGKKVMRITEMRDLTMSSYPGLAAEVERELWRYVDFLQDP